MILDCARRTSTFRACAFREQEDNQATLPPPFFQQPAKHLCARMGVMTRWPFLLLMLVGLFCLAGTAHAQPMEDSHPTTERSCSFGMAKEEGSQTCLVPFPLGCLVAHIPGTNRPWTTISKGGNTFCQFDEKATDWKTKIVGSCTRCKSDHCSAQFVVRFDCSRSAQ